MAGFKRFPYVFLLTFLLLAACREQEPGVITENSRGIDTPAATAAIVPGATKTAVLPTLTASPLPPTMPPPTPTRPSPTGSPPTPTGTPALAYDCPLELPMVSGDIVASHAPLRVAFIAENGIQLWDEASNARTLLFEADDVSSLAFSDDRQLLAFTRQNEQYQISLWVMGAGGQDARELLSAADLLALNLSPTKDLAVDPYRLAWIPGTHRLAFSTRTITTGDGLPDVFQELRVIDADTGSLVDLINDTEGGTYTFSPDGDFFVRASDTSVSLFQSSGELVAGDIVIYPALGLGGYTYHPPINWDDDSQTFALATINTADSLEATYSPDVTSTIYRIAVDGSVSELATMTGMAQDHVFSPDLEKVAFMRNSPKGPPLRELHIADVRNAWDIIYREGETLFFGQWNPAGETLQFIYYDDWADPGIGRLCQAAAPLPSVSGPDYTRWAEWVDAARYLYMALPEGDLYLGSLDGTQKLAGRMDADRVSGREGPLKNFDVYRPDSQAAEPGFAE
jgi:hypothetical protein